MRDPVFQKTNCKRLTKAKCRQTGMPIMWTPQVLDTLLSEFLGSSDALDTVEVSTVLKDSRTPTAISKL